jgi:protein-S-isoprenylcysteine O-methyltransferase Ste14
MRRAALRADMDATRRQRTLRALVLLAAGFGGILLASLDPARAVRDPAFALLGGAMTAWTIGENLALRQDEPPDYRGKRNTRLLQAGVVLACMIAAFDRWQLPETLLPRTLAVSIAGALVILAGAALRIAAIRTLDRHFRYELRVEEGQRIVDRGVFRFVRHPSYLGVLLIVLGDGLVLASAPAMLLGGALLAALLALRIREEERVLVEAFGPAYEAYRARSWRLIPPIY